MEVFQEYYPEASGRVPKFIVLQDLLSVGQWKRFSSSRISPQNAYSLLEGAVCFDFPCFSVLPVCRHRRSSCHSSPSFTVYRGSRLAAKTSEWLPVFSEAQGHAVYTACCSSEGATAYQQENQPGLQKENLPWSGRWEPGPPGATQGGPRSGCQATPRLATP